MKPTIFALPFLLLPWAPAPTSPPRDIIPPGMHGIEFVLSVDASAISSCRCRPYEVAQGDTIVEGRALRRRDPADEPGGEGR